MRSEYRRFVVLERSYQVAKLVHRLKHPDTGEQIEADLSVPETGTGEPAWPGDEMERIRVVRDMLGRAAAPLTLESLSAAFRGRRSAGRERGVEKVLRTLVAAGVAQERTDGPHGGSQFFIPR